MRARWIPALLFAPSPELPPCGAGAAAARSRVDPVAVPGAGLNWSWARPGPAAVCVEIQDRLTGRTARSKPVKPSSPPPRAPAGP